MTDLKSPPLDASVPANNQKIIELYNKMRIGQINVNADYQRKLVWRKTHKINFIDTILKNYPFPEIYLAPGNLDPIALTLVDEIVDGQQRLTTIKNYIEGVDVFALNRLQVKKFNELDVEEKSRFLNYEVSIRYLKNATQEQVREIFVRINKTDYALNSTERLHAQWGDSEFVCFAKQMVDEKINQDSVVNKFTDAERNCFIEFFHGYESEDSVFTENDMSRMLAMQYILTLVSTVQYGEYFSRNDKVQNYIEVYYEEYDEADVMKNKLIQVIQFVKSLNIARHSVWFNKANLFTLMVELSKVNLPSIDTDSLKGKLVDLESRYVLSGISAEDDIGPEERKYFDCAREAVNEKAVREYRGDFISKLIASSI